MSQFDRPYIAAAMTGANKDKKARRGGKRLFPYPRKLYETTDVFPLLVLDGGAFFFSHAHLGGGTAEHFMAALESGDLLRPWTVRGRVQWDKAYEDTAGRPSKTAHEKHVWLNRLYFLLPIAQTFLRTGKESWAKLWLDYFTDWAKAHPYPPVQAEDPGTALPDDHAKLCWHDMQVTWRLLVLIHSVYLLERSRTLKRPQWQAIHLAIYQHTKHVHIEADRALAVKKGRGNHFLQKGVALLYAGLLFPELPESESFIATGRAVVEQQMRSEVHPDGGSVEASPSYSHFIARLYLDAFLLLHRNRQPPIKGLKTCIQKQYRFLDETASSAGRTLQLSDSYAFDADADLKLVAKLLPFPRATRTSSVCFNNSSFAVLRSKRAAVYLDGMALGLWHHHRGKPNLLLDVDDQPVLVDSGCCDYDLTLRDDWLKTAGAHNVVLVSSERDERGPLASSDIPVIHVAGFEKKRDRSVVMMVHEFNSPDLAYEWSRTVLLRAKTIEVLDRVTAPAPVFARQVFHFAPLNVELSGDARQATIQRPDDDLVLRQVGGSNAGHFELTYRPAVGLDNDIVHAAEMSSWAHGRDIQFHVSFALP